MTVLLLIYPKEVNTCVYKMSCKTTFSTCSYTRQKETAFGDSHSRRDTSTKKEIKGLWFGQQGWPRSHDFMGMKSDHKEYLLDCICEVPEHAIHSDWDPSGGGLQRQDLKRRDFLILIRVMAAWRHFIKVKS